MLENATKKVFRITDLSDFVPIIIDLEWSLFDNFTTIPATFLRRKPRRRWSGIRLVILNQSLNLFLNLYLTLNLCLALTVSWAHNLLGLDLSLN